MSQTWEYTIEVIMNPKLDEIQVIEYPFILH